MCRSALVSAFFEKSPKSVKMTLSFCAVIASPSRRYRRTAHPSRTRTRAYTRYEITLPLMGGRFGDSDEASGLRDPPSPDRVSTSSKGEDSTFVDSNTAKEMLKSTPLKKC